MTVSASWPGGVQTIAPYFTVDDADRLIEFIGTVFNAQVLKLNRYEDGAVQHARMQIGECVVMINQSSQDYAPNISQMHIYVEDMQCVFTDALENGATELMAPNRRGHGDLMAGVKDPCGNIWWIAQPGSDL